MFKAFKIPAIRQLAPPPELLLLLLLAGDFALTSVGDTGMTQTSTVQHYQQPRQRLFRRQLGGFQETQQPWRRSSGLRQYPRSPVGGHTAETTLLSASLLK